MAWRKVLIAFNGSPLSMHAIEYGGKLADEVGGEVAIVFVLDPGEAVSNVGGIRPDQLMSEMRIEAQQRLDAAISILEPGVFRADFLVVGKSRAGNCAHRR